MPYVFDPLDEEEGQEQGSQPQMTGGGSTFGAGSSGLSSDSAKSKGTNTQGSGFVGLDQYLKANKGSQFGKQLTGNVAGAVNQAKQGLQTGADEFTQASNQGTTRWGDVGDEFKGIVDRAGSGTTQAEKDRAKSLQTAAYQGPESFGGTSAFNRSMGGVQKAKQEAKALQSEGGRFALLDQYFGRPKYSMGEKTLDNVLATGTPGVAAKSSALQNQANRLDQQARQTGQGLENLVASNRQQTADTARQAKDYAQGSLTGFQDDLTKRHSDMTSGADAYNQAMRGMASEIGSGADPTSRDYSTDDLYDILGVGGNTDLYGLTGIENYLNEADPVTLSEFTSPEEAARLRVLGELSGNFQDPLVDAEIGRGGDGRVTADKNALGRAIGGRRSEYEGRLSGDMPQAYSGLPTTFNNWNEWLNMMETRTTRPVKMQDTELAALAELNSIRRAYGQAPIAPNLVLRAQGDDDTLLDESVGGIGGRI